MASRPRPPGGAHTATRPLLPLLRGLLLALLLTLAPAVAQEEPPDEEPPEEGPPDDGAAEEETPGGDGPPAAAAGPTRALAWIVIVLALAGLLYLYGSRRGR